MYLIVMVSLLHPTILHFFLIFSHVSLSLHDLPLSSPMLIPLFPPIPFPLSLLCFIIFFFLLHFTYLELLPQFVSFALLPYNFLYLFNVLLFISLHTSSHASSCTSSHASISITSHASSLTLHLPLLLTFQHLFCHVLVPATHCPSCPPFSFTTYHISSPLSCSCTSNSPPSSQTYKCLASLKQHHKRDHERRRPYACEMCSKDFFSKSDFKYHMR